ncbi:MAG: hypothetical protein FJY85_20710, partial [Deltaproteobacteria bacterium]|nr:hypothetical protein [Deltaproteobacteria bacterium]
MDQDKKTGCSAKKGVRIPMLQKEHSAGLTDSQIQKLLAQSLGHHMKAFRCSRAVEGLVQPEAFETILYSLDKQDLIHVLKIVENLSTTQSPRLALHTLVKGVTEILGVARSSLIFLNQARGIGTVVISQEDPNFKGVAIPLDSYPEILQ